MKKITTALAAAGLVAALSGCQAFYSVFPAEQTAVAGDPVQEVGAVTEVFGNGQKITAAVVKYAGNISNSSLQAEDFAVAGRKVTKVYTNNPQARAQRMNAVNPLYILRNYLLEQAIVQAKNGDFREIERLHRCMQNPFEARQEFADFAELPPQWAGGICVSCSS